MGLDEIVMHMAKLKREDAKRVYLQKIIGPKTYNPETMHFRAMLMTVLNRAEIWPHRA